jgi:hypothetical protein
VRLGADPAVELASEDDPEHPRLPHHAANSQIHEIYGGVSIRNFQNLVRRRRAASPTERREP